MKKTFVKLIALVICIRIANAYGTETEASLTCDFNVIDAQSLIASGEFKNAIETILAPAIRQLNFLEEKDGRRFYCSRGETETLEYLLRASRDKVDAVIVDYNFALALHLDAYIDGSDGRLQEARGKLMRAVELAPRNAVFISELAYLFQRKKLWRESLNIYEKAIEAAKGYSPEKVKVHELGRALRGKGYSLVELGRFEDAKHVYEECININPNDEKSKSELEYIRRKQEGRR